MIETVFSCLLLMLFFIGGVSILNMVRTSLYVNRIAREGAREAAITDSISAGEAKARDCADQFFKTSSTITLTNNGGNVICKVIHPEKAFGKVVNMGAQAVYPWWDQAPQK